VKVENYKKVGQYFSLGMVIIISIILLDQYTKWRIIETILALDGHTALGFKEWLLTRHPIEFFVDEREKFKMLATAPMLNLVVVWNQGVSFGLLNIHSTYMPLVLIGVSLLISFSMVLWLALTPKKLVAASLSFIIGGALANVIDRIRFNAVIDFIDVYYKNYHWPAFNVADSCIVFGAFLLVVESLRSQKELDAVSKKK
jgi:signal peptidase II